MKIKEKGKYNVCLKIVLEETNRTSKTNYHDVKSYRYLKQQWSTVKVIVNIQNKVYK